MPLPAFIESPAFWTALPSILWFCLAVILLALFRASIHEVLSHLLLRVRSGASMKFGAWEIGPVSARQLHDPPPAAAAGSESMPEKECEPSTPGGTGDPKIAPDVRRLAEERAGYYRTARRVMLVHRLFRSARRGQDYDILIYVIPHTGGTLVQVTEVAYFFGRYWGNRVFKSFDRSRGFPVMVSAYGTFLCTARVTFNDGTSVVLHRYIDFEMGAAAPMQSGSEAK